MSETKYISLKDGEKEYVFYDEEFNAGDFLYLISQGFDLEMLIQKKDNSDSEFLKLIFEFLRKRYVQKEIPFEKVPIRVLMKNENMNTLIQSLVQGLSAEDDPGKKKA